MSRSTYRRQPDGSALYFAGELVRCPCPHRKPPLNAPKDFRCDKGLIVWTVAMQVREAHHATEPPLGGGRMVCPGCSRPLDVWPAEAVLAA